MKFIFYFVSAFAFTFHINAQDTIPKQGMLKFFLDRHQCDFNYGREVLATTYEVQGRLGLRFTFGSIFNNVVNERFKME